MADKKKATVLDMTKYMDQSVRVKFMGGREVQLKAVVREGQQCAGG